MRRYTREEMYETVEALNAYYSNGELAVEYVPRSKGHPFAVYVLRFRSNIVPSEEVIEATTTADEMCRRLRGKKYNPFWEYTKEGQLSAI